MISLKELNFPTHLTLFRLCVAPIILPILLVYVAPFNIPFLNGALAFLFLLFGFTDFLDGFLARRYQQVTELGKTLDPMADKFLIYSTLIGLLAAHKIYFMWVVILIGRDFFMMGLRQIALEYGFSVPVSLWGKLKTMLQVLCIAFIILNSHHQEGLCGQPYWNGFELLLLSITTFFAVYSALNYYQSFMKSYKKHTAYVLAHESEEDDL